MHSHMETVILILWLLKGIDFNFDIKLLHTINPLSTKFALQCLPVKLSALYISKLLSACKGRL